MEISSVNDVILCYKRDNNNLSEVILHQEDRFLNTLVVGPTGTGKTSQIFMPLIFQDLLNENVGITIFDPKEELSLKIKDYAEQLNNRKIIYIDPIDSHCPKINLFNGNSNQVSDLLIRIFANINKNEDLSERNNKYICRTLIQKSINILKEYPSLCGNNLNINTYSEFISNKYGVTKIKLTKLLDSIENSDKNNRIAECKWLLDQYFNLSTGIFEKCAIFRSKIEELSSNAYLSSIFSNENIKGNILNFDECIAYGYIVIINSKNTLLGYLGKLFAEILMYIYVSSVFRRFEYNKTHNVKYLKANFLYIDEFATFDPVTIDLFTQGRAFKIGTHITIQNRTLLKICGNLDTTTESLVIESNTRNIILFPGLNGEDAEYYSKQFFNITASQILYRPFGQIIYKIISNKNILPPDIGLVFFINETPHLNSISKEYKFDENGNILWKKIDI